jgi:hypothetical protein
MTSKASVPRPEWTARLSREAREHPLRLVGVALGVGFVLGGGLYSRLAARLVGAGVRLGLRMAVAPLMAQGLIALGESLSAPRASSTEARDVSQHSHDAGKTRRRTHEAQ